MENLVDSLLPSPTTTREMFQAITKYLSENGVTYQVVAEVITLQTNRGTFTIYATDDRIRKSVKTYCECNETHYEFFSLEDVVNLITKHK